MDLSVETLRRLPLELRIEIEENSQRKDLTQSEIAEQQTSKSSLSFGARLANKAAAPI